MEAVRTFKTNLKLEGKPCGWCQQPLKLGEDASVCTACETAHHMGCWEGKAGCSKAGCANAPLPQLDPPPVLPPVAPAAAGMMYCPQCRAYIPVGMPVCSFCSAAITGPGGLYHRLGNAPGAVSSMVFGIIGLLICGVIFGPIALVKSAEARRAIAENPAYEGGGMATAGLVLGIIDLVAWGIIMLARFSGR